MNKIVILKTIVLMVVACVPSILLSAYLTDNLYKFYRLHIPTVRIFEIDGIFVGLTVLILCTMLAVKNSKQNIKEF